MDELEMLETLTFMEPCERARLQFEANGSRRYMPLSNLVAPKGHCVWCDKKLVGRQQRWCSTSCVSAAQWRAAPQSPAAKIYRLIHSQNWSCKACGLSFEEEMRKDIREKYEQNSKIRGTPGNNWQEDHYGRKSADEPPKKITYYWIGSNTGHIHQTDHIIPIHKGGLGIDPANLQTICTECHLRKSVEDRRRG